MNEGTVEVRARGDQTGTSGRSGARIHRPPTSEQVSEHVRRLIFDGELHPGDRIPQDAIAAELGVSRIPVREALIEMARDGLVVAEGAGTLILEDLDRARARGATIHAEVIGFGASCDGTHVTNPSAEGMASARTRLRRCAGLTREL